MLLAEPRLLIADDDRDFRESLGEVFRRRGYVTEFAADGWEAVEIVRTQSRLHLVLLDVHMPRLSGLEALGKIRCHVDTPLPAILMSAKLDRDIVQQAEAFEPICVLAKPFSLHDITTQVACLLREFYGADR